MIEPRDRKTKWLHIRLNEAEYAKITGFWKSTTAQKLSDYCRKVILLKPVVINHRDQSLDEFLAELISLKKELNAIGNNYNQTVKRLHTLGELSEFKGWIAVHEIQKQALINKIDEIKLRMNQLYHLWSQKSTSPPA